MNEEMRAEAIEISITACEKYAPNYEVGGFFVCYYTQFYKSETKQTKTFNEMIIMLLAFVRIGSGKNN